MKPYTVPAPGWDRGWWRGSWLGRAITPSALPIHRLFGFKDVVLYRNCSQPNALVLNTGHPWPVYANPGILLLLYYTVATLVKLRRLDARVRGCGAKPDPVPMPGVPRCSDRPSPGTGGARWRGGGGQQGARWRGALAGAPGMILLPRWLQWGALSWLLPLTENRSAGTAAGKVPGKGAGGAGELAQGHRWRG